MTPPDKSTVPNEANDQLTNDALAAARRVHEDAASVGFDWPTIDGVIDKVKEELREIEHALAQGDTSHARKELGDLLFTVVNLSRFLDIDASRALREATSKFHTRFLALNDEIARQGRRIEACSLEELDNVWEDIKTRQGE